MLNSILSNIKKKSKSDLKLERPVPDFIPYACHYNGQTMITKNGELLQVLKITGFVNQSLEGKELNLRDIVRESILDNIKSDDFALWFHTIRRHKNLDPGGKFDSEFASSLNSSWKNKHHLDSMYVNELYITIIRDGIKEKFFDFKSIVGSLFFWPLKRHHDKEVKKCYTELKSAVDGMIKTLSPFGVRRLGVEKKGSVYYSEPLRFLFKILNLAEVPIKMPINDVSEYLATHSIAMGFNTIEVRGEKGRNFGAMFTVKEYHEITTKALDEFLQLPQEFIISQTLDFINSKKALASFKKQQDILSYGKSENLSKIVGLDNIVKSDNGTPVAFGDSQITILLINKELKGLNQNIESAVKKLSKLGIVITRRDLRLEECFWAQLPANFSFVSRKKAISTSTVAGFASLYNFPAGKVEGSVWGKPVTLFHTAKGTPYFFNFHDGANGHTSIVGPKGGGKTVLMNFLLSEARKFNTKLFLFDQERASKVFIKSIGGYYTIIKPSEKSPEYAFNPFQMDDTVENKDFLRKWLVILAESFGEKISDAEKKHLSGLVDHMYGLPQEKRKLSSLSKMFGNANLTKKMSVWHSDGEYAHLFDNDRKGIVSLYGAIYGFGMSHVVEDKTCLGPVLSYLFHRVEMSLDGTPSIIVLDEAWNLVNNPLFAPTLSSWLDRMREKNAIVIFATETVLNDRKNEVTNVVVNKIATQIFLANQDADISSNAYKKTWGLSGEEFDMLAKMKVKKHHFLLKKEGIAVVATLNLEGLKELDVLSGDDRTVTIMEEAVKEKGEEPKDWLSLFYERVKSEETKIF